MRVLLLFLILALGLSLSASAAVYRWVDENGNVVYSDKPQPGAEAIEMREIQTIQAPPVAPITAKEVPPPPEFPGYEQVAIVSPENDAAVRENAGNVTVTVALEPALQTTLGHRIALFVDGAQVSEPGTATQFSLINMDRGTHTLEAKVIDSDGKAIASSPPSEFHLLRHSILLPTPTPTPLPTAPAPVTFPSGGP
ncbi:MAG: DUF4124 domain-containing protein [Gammaproteobacteria bacterium]|nr:DUF4124 domain-containing protein [Gammaproteobacteria bacterium]MCI0590836.1 DUF4124 domain-containing protein [Gammaproteobacteria bacterium]